MEKFWDKLWDLVKGDLGKFGLCFLSSFTIAGFFLSGHAPHTKLVDILASWINAEPLSTRGMLGWGVFIALTAVQFSFFKFIVNTLKERRNKQPSLRKLRKLVPALSLEETRILVGCVNSRVPFFQSNDQHIPTLALIEKGVVKKKIGVKRGLRRYALKPHVFNFLMKELHPILEKKRKQTPCNE